MFKDLPSRIESNMHPEFRSKKRHRFHPKMMDEMMHMSKNNKIGILFGLGMLKEGMPWLYDVGIDTLRTLDTDSAIKEKEQAVFEFQDLVEMSSRGPMMEGFMDSKSDFMLYQELPRMIIREMKRYMERKLK